MSRYTMRPEDGIDADLEADFQLVISAVRDAGIKYDAFYLVGGFGRGEGSVEHDGARWRAVNDYDFFLVGDFGPQERAQRAQLGRELAPRVGVDYVDLGLFPRTALRSAGPSIQNYEFKYGSMRLDGADVLAEMPEFTPEQIPPYELVRLICNRAAGMLTADLPEHRNCPHYRQNQITKALIAVGDTAAYLAGRYGPRYSDRAQSFGDLAHAAGAMALSTREAEQIMAAYEWKLNGREPLGEIAPAVVAALLMRAYCRIAGRCLGKEVVASHRAFVGLCRKYGGAYTGVGRRMAGWILRQRRPVNDKEVFYRILFSQPFIYHAGRRSRLGTASAYAYCLHAVPGALRRPWTGQSVVRLWMENCH